MALIFVVFSVLDLKPLSRCKGLILSFCTNSAYLRVYMKPLLYLLAVMVCAGPSMAQERMYRCDNNYYTNSLTDPKAHNCKALEGGNLTIVQGTKVAPLANSGSASPVKIAAAPQSAQPGQRVDSTEQRGRDSDARIILESELKKAETRREELSREYNNGEPEKRGTESRNYQTYLDRVAEIKSSLARLDSDIAGIRRELGRLPASSASR